MPQQRHAEDTSSGVGGPVESDRSWLLTSDEIEAVSIHQAASDDPSGVRSERPEASDASPLKAVDATSEPPPTDWPKGRLLDSIIASNWCTSTKSLQNQYLWARENADEDDFDFKVLKASLYKVYTAPVIAHLAKSGDRKRAMKLANCGTWKLYQQGELTGKIACVAANYCSQSKLCATCARYRSRKVIASYVKRTHALMLEDDLIPVMITLTTKSKPDLMGAVNDVIGHLNTVKQYRKNYFADRISFNEFCRFKHAVWHLEIKRGTGSKDWHPHFHGVALVRRSDFVNPWKPFDLDAMHAEWTRMTGQSGRPDVRHTDAGKMLLKQPHLVEENDLKKLLGSSLMEVFKYQLKFDAEMTPADRVDVFEKTHKLRFLRPWGGYFGTKIPPELVDDEITDEAYELFVLRWLWSQGYYRRSSC